MSKYQVGTNFGFIEDNYRNPDIFGLVEEGGSRSGKTWDTIAWICHYVNNNTGKIITIGRDKMTSLKKTLLLDWQVIAPKFGLPMYNKSEMFLNYNGNHIRFVGVNDDIMSAHGLKQDVLWLNEAMSIGPDTFNQMKQRTSEFFILDYNPSAPTHWIYDLEKRHDVVFHKTTVLDNPFAPKQNIKEILSYEPYESGSYYVENNTVMYNGATVSEVNQPPPHIQNVAYGTADRFMWEVYGLGLRSQSEEIIYKQWEYFNEDNFPDLREGYKIRVLGLDFGYTNDPTAVIEVIVHGNSLYATELVYETGLLMDPLADKIRPYQKGDTLTICDRGRPDSRDELILRNILVASSPGAAGQASIDYGINVIKGYKLYVNEKSVNLQNELTKYKYKVDDKTGEVTNKPVDKDNHLLDALRYGITFFAPQLIENKA